MKIRTLTLGGVAGLSLVAVLAASPSFAQSTDSGPQYSTPAEKAQTNQLNNQAAAGTEASPASLNGDGTDADQPSAQNAQIQQQNQANQKDYAAQMKRYDAQRARYDRNMRRYDETRYAFTDYPHGYAYRYDGDGIQKLYVIAEPSQQLDGTAVEGPDGSYIGKVRNVEVGFDGRPSHVEVALNQRVSVWVDPSDLRFDAADHVVFTQLTRSDLWDMHGARYSGAM